jgi:hypothetical protein
MATRLIGLLSRLAFLVCGIISVLLSNIYRSLQGLRVLPNSELAFVLYCTLTVAGVFSVVIALLPNSWVEKACKHRTEQTLVGSHQDAWRLRCIVLSLACGFLLCTTWLASEPTVGLFRLSSLCADNHGRPLAWDVLVTSCPFERGSLWLARGCIGIRLSHPSQGAVDAKSPYRSLTCRKALLSSSATKLH